MSKEFINMTNQSSLSETHRALVQQVYGAPLQVEVRPALQATAGSAIVRILAASIISYQGDIYNGKRKYPYPTPMVPGTNSIGRIAALGPDSVLLKVGQLVLIDGTIRGRDDPSAIFLSGVTEGGTDGSRKLMRGEWRDSTFAEYAKLPLENCHILDENRLIEELGYTVEQLTSISRALVPYGGLASIGLKAGETVVIAPATGGFGGAAVQVALAMGARVIAMGRNEKALAALKELGPRVETVPIIGDSEKELASLKKFGTIDAFFDISPPAAQNSTHFKSAILALKHEGRVSLMGGLLGDIALPHRFIMRFDILLKGKWMYHRHDISAFIKMVETGIFPLENVKIIRKFSLEDWEQAFASAAEHVELGEITVFTP
jgi:threonine dehydrogenase-like Zn-dependent dehydrogenase